MNGISPGAWKHQHELGPVKLYVDWTELGQLGVKIEQAPQAIKEAVLDRTHEIVHDIYDRAKANLDGGLLQVQTGRLLGSWQEDLSQSGAEAETDVFYGSLHDTGFADRARHKRWLTREVEAETGGRPVEEWVPEQLDAAFLAALERGLS